MSIDCRNTYATPCPTGCWVCGLPYDKRPGARTWDVRGMDRALGALGLLEQFRITVTAAMPDVTLAARRARYAAGRQDVRVEEIRRHGQTLAESDGLRGLIHPED